MWFFFSVRTFSIKLSAFFPWDGYLFSRYDIISYIWRRALFAKNFCTVHKNGYFYGQNSLLNSVKWVLQAQLSVYKIMKFFLSWALSLKSHIAPLTPHPYPQLFMIYFVQSNVMFLPHQLERNLHETVCRQMQTNQLQESCAYCYAYHNVIQCVGTLILMSHPHLKLTQISILIINISKVQALECIWTS